MITIRLRVVEQKIHKPCRKLLYYSNLLSLLCGTLPFKPTYGMFLCDKGKL